LAPVERVRRKVARLSGPQELTARWRAEAAVLRRRGAELQAAVLEGAAGELDEWARTWELEVLTLSQAAAASGYSYSALQHLVAAGRIKNAGTAHRPRIRRSDLPWKAGNAPATGLALADRVLAARQRRPA